MRRWFVTGANRGIGAAIVRAALAAGDQVAATVRKPDQVRDGANDRLRWIELDVIDAARCEESVQKAIDWAGGIDVLVNNAGYGQTGFFELVSADAITTQFATNLFGAMHVTRAALPAMRAAGKGHILGISSISGFVGDPGASVYCASKFALEGWLEGLAAEIAPFGLRTTLVEPGPFRTDFFEPSSLRLGDLDLPAYREQALAARAWMESENGRQLGDPERLADAILTLVACDAPPLRFAAGAMATQRLRAKGESLRAAADDWERLSLATDYPV